MTCGRCRSQQLPWELRTFGDKNVCKTCYGATIELGRAAIKGMPDDEPKRNCSSCRALHNPSLGSAWCAVLELGDERARICANFVPLSVDQARDALKGGRVELLDLWQSLSDDLRSTLGAGSYATWFAGVEPVDMDDTTLVLSVPDEYTRASLEGRFSSVIQHALGEHNYGHLTPSYTLESDAPVIAPSTTAVTTIGTTVSTTGPTTIDATHRPNSAPEFWLHSPTLSRERLPAGPFSSTFPMMATLRAI